MASQVPAKLKPADISRFALRATQLQTAKPEIAYWCEYWIVQQIIAKGLHNADAECLQYTTTLMDKLEQTKTEYATNDAIIDDTAGQAFVENFALTTFQRADNAVQADKVTKQTADTFLAAATFFDLLSIWGEPEPEVLAKIKYAKYHALRIVKAIKEGKDPNESNPKPEPTREESLPALDPNDPEVQELEGEGNDKALQPSVEEVPDEQDGVEHQLARQSTLDRSLHPSAQPSARVSPGGGTPTNEFEPFPRDGFPYNVAKDNEQLDTSATDRNGSVGGGYFPEVPSGLGEDSMDITTPVEMPDTSTPEFSKNDFSSFPPPIISTDEDTSLPSAPQDFYTQAPPPQQAPPQQAPPPQAPVAQPVRAPQPPPVTQPVSTGQLNTDDASIAKAQKHARWAISALNFEDAATAVKELKAALQTLGAQ